MIGRVLIGLMLAGLGCAAAGLALLVARGAEPGGIEEAWLLFGPSLSIRMPRAQEA